MNKIEKLLEELCPDGVEWKELGDVCSVNKGKQLNKNKLTEDGEYPAYNGGKSFSGRTDNYNVEANTIIISQGGASAGFVNYVNTRFWANAHCYYLIPDLKFVNNRYIYHFIKMNQDYLMDFQHGAGIPALKLDKITKLKIPIPPLEIQEEIVKILDKLTEYVTELTAELTLRNKHYEYYREKLLTFKEPNIEWKELKEICSYSKERISYIDLNEENYVTVENILDNKRGKTKSNNIPLSGNFIRFDKCDILLGNIRPYLKKIWFADTEGGSNNDVLVIKINDTSINTVNSRFLYQVLSSDSFFEYNIKHSRGAKMPRGNKEKILEYKIPIPPLNIQKRIVEVLDNFEAICKDLNIGLPKEIELHQKQYEFYREKLLTFDGEYGKPKLAETTITD